MKEQVYITLQEATQHCNYSQEYLSLRARQGKLKAIKLGRNWLTSKEWLDDYVKTTQEYINYVEELKKQKVAVQAPDNLQPEGLAVISQLKSGINDSETASDRFEFSSIGKNNFIAPLAVLLSAGVLFISTGVFAFPGQEINEWFYGYNEILATAYQEADSFANDLGIYYEDLGRETASEYVKVFVERENRISDLGEIVSVLDSAKRELAFQKFTIDNKLGQSRKSLSEILFFDNLKSELFFNYNILSNDIDNFIRVVSDAGRSSQNASLSQISSWKQSYVNLNNLIEQNLLKARDRLATRIKKINSIVIGKMNESEKIVVPPQPQKEEIAPVVQNEALKPAESLSPSKEIVIREITKETTIQPVREITRETIITKMNEESAKAYFEQLKSLIDSQAAYQSAQFASLSTEINKRPTPISFSSPTTVIQQSNTTNKLSQDKGEVTLETTGSGNIVLRSAGSIVVSGSTLAVGANLDVTALQTITVSSDSTALTITQSGSGNLIDIKDGSQLVFSISDGGYATLATDASTTPSFLIRAQGITSSFSSSTYFAIDATSSFDGRMIDLAISGTSVFYIDSAGNIQSSGTVSYGTTTVTGDFTVDTDTFYVDSINNRVGIGTTSPSNLFTVGTTTDAIFTVTTEGNVGIGTSAPTGLFHVATSTDALYINTEGSVAFGTSTNFGIFTVGTTTDSIFNITTEGYVGIGTTSPSGLFSIATSSDILLVLNTGLVGISTTTPTYALDVAGTVQMTGFSMPNGASVSYVLTSDANGIGTWQAAAGGAADSSWTISSLSMNATDTIDNITMGTSTTLYLDLANNKTGIGTSTLSGLFTIGTTTEPFFNITTEGNLAVGTSTSQGIFTVGTTTGNAAFNVTTEGFVGIGTAAPDATFVVNDPGDGNPMIKFKRTAAGGDLDAIRFVSNGNGAGTNYRWLDMKMAMPAGGVDEGRAEFWMGNNAAEGTSPYLAMAIRTNGNISFGTSTDQGLFTVGTTTNAFFNITTEGNLAVGVAAPQGIFTVASSSTPMLNITTAGYVGVGVASADSILSVNDPGTGTPMVRFRRTAAGGDLDSIRLISDGNGAGTNYRWLDIGMTMPAGGTDTAYTYFNTGNNSTEGAVLSGAFAMAIRTDGTIAIGTSTTLGLFTIGTSTESFFNITTEGNLAIGTTTTSGIFNVGTSSDSILSITTQGYVGIGVPNPVGLLNIAKTSDAATNQDVMYLDVGSDGSPDAGEGPSIGFRVPYTTTPGAEVHVGGIGMLKESNTDDDTSGYMYFSTKTNAGSVAERMRIDSAGNVGIATTTPTLKLHVEGVAGLPATSGTAQTGIMRLSQTGGAAVLDFGNNGSVGSWLQSTRVNDLSVSDPLILNPNGGNVTIGTSTTDGVFYVGTTSDPVFLVTTEGNVGIGTASATARMTINNPPSTDTQLVFQVNSIDRHLIYSDNTDGNLYFAKWNGSAWSDLAFLSSSSIFVPIDTTASTERLCWDASGASTIRDCTGSPGDYAEHYGTADSSIEAGDVVVIDSERSAEQIVKDEFETSKSWIVKSTQPYQRSIIGVISTQPNEIIGEVFEPSENPRPVALSGRVPVKVSAENGPIEIGDSLTSSNQPGVAMKATGAGRVIGSALEPYSGEGVGKITVFLNYHWQGNDLAVVQDESGQLVSIDKEQLKTGLSSLGLVISEDGNLEVQSLKAEKQIETKKILAEEFEMKDKSTGGVYCTWIENGEWVKVSGPCENQQSQPVEVLAEPVQENVADPIQENVEVIPEPVQEEAVIEEAVPVEDPVQNDPVEDQAVEPEVTL